MNIETCKKLLDSGNYDDVLIATTWIASNGKKAENILRELGGKGSAETRQFHYSFKLQFKKQLPFVPNEEEYVARRHYFYQISRDSIYVDVPSLARKRIRGKNTFFSEVCHTFGR